MRPEKNKKTLCVAFSLAFHSIHDFHRCIFSLGCRVDSVRPATKMKLDAWPTFALNQPPSQEQITFPGQISVS